MIKKIYMVIAFIFSAKIGIEEHSFEEFGLSLIVFGAFYLFFKIMFGAGRQQAKSSGGFGRWFMSMMDTSKNDKQIIRGAMDAVDMAREKTKKNQLEMDERSRRYNNTQKDARIHQNYANTHNTAEGQRYGRMANRERNTKF